jgi:hypothetical protein
MGAVAAVVVVAAIIPAIHEQAVINAARKTIMMITKPTISIDT